jgi:hypothetical protein
MIDQQLDGARCPRSSADEPARLEHHDQAVDARRGDPEVALHVGFRGRLPVELRVEVDKGEVLALLGGERCTHGIDKLSKS